jgi:hypothetical protein
VLVSGVPSLAADLDIASVSESLVTPEDLPGGAVTIEDAVL